LEHQPWLKDVLVFFAAAGLIVPMFHRARIGAVLGFLLIGVAAGPFGLGQYVPDYPWLSYITFEDQQRAVTFAEFGVLFLLFLIGLQMSVERLWSLRHYVLGIGGIHFALSAVAIWAVIVTFFDAPMNPAIVLGLAFAMSSTAIVMQLLEEQGRVVSQVGRIAFAVLLFQDLMVAPVLLVTQLLGRGGENLAAALATGVLQALAAVALILVAGRFVLRPLLRFAAQTGGRELIMAITLLIVIGTAGATGHAGLSTALGAFLAGLMLSETEYRHQIEVDLLPVKGLFIGLFFISIGMTVDLRVVWNNIGDVLRLVAILFLVKGALMLAACRIFRIGFSPATDVALLLAQAGEFVFVVVVLARNVQLLSDPTVQRATAVATISMMLTPLLALCGRWLAGRMQHIDHEKHMPTADARELKDHVVIGGYGRMGQIIARLCAAQNVTFIALDTDGETVTAARAQGHNVYFGDSSRRELLDRVGAESARAFVVTVDSPPAAERMVAAVRRKRKDVPVFARARDQAHAARLLKLGALAVVPETVETSLQLGARVLESLGFPPEAVERVIAEMREREIGDVVAPDDHKAG
jgi:CPA2 family monovalent cation:H+ antiporter-2